MSSCKKPLSAFFLSIVLAVTVTAIIIILCVSCSGSKIKYKSSFYFVCYAVSDNSVSAGSFSSAVSSYGGAGYVLEYGGAYYVTVSCYYSRNDAETVCESLKRRELNCSVLEITTEEYPLKSLGARRCAELYTGNFNTLNSLAVLCYDCANALDTGDGGQTATKSAVAGARSSLNGLLHANPDNCFTPHIKRLIAECDALSDGYIYSKDMRKLQIAIADVIINIELF